MEAHNGLSACIAEEAGFAGIWASGLALSAQFGVRDSNEASWTQLLEMVEFMADRTRVPILLDGDTGYGNFNNMRRLVHKLEQRGIAGVCIEDKLFPKTNSFINGDRQPLADAGEFCGKIKAAKDSQSDTDFCVVARVEALIAGWGMDEALARAEAYREAGADAILIHSKRPRPDEILAFAGQWAGRAPLVIVPTKYYSTPTEVFRRAGISTVIWANHQIRAATAAMQSVTREIFAAESVANIEDRISSVDEIFRLQGAAELAEAEARYLTSRRRDSSAVVLAASRGEGLDSVTEDRPKVMLPVAGVPLLRRLVDTFKRQQVNRITVVAGYKPEAVTVSGVQVVKNPDYRSAGELTSLDRAVSAVTDDTVILYGDLLFREYVLHDLLEQRAPITIVVDSAGGDASSEVTDRVYCSAPDDRSVFDQEVRLERVDTGSGLAQDCPAQGCWIGMLRVQGPGRGWLLDGLSRLRQREDFKTLGVPHLLNYLVAQGHPVQVQYITGHWLDVNRMEDLSRAGDFARGDGGRGTHRSATP